jgi:hypothetical protein
MIKRDRKKVNFKVVLDNGKEVDVTYDPGFINHLEFRGPVSETGYRSDFPFKLYAKPTLEQVKALAKKRAEEFYKLNPAKHGSQKTLF